MRVLRLEADRLWLDLERTATDAVVRHLSLYRVGQEVEIVRPSRRRRSCP